MTVVNCLEFDIGDWAAIPEVTLSGDFTIEAWSYIDPASGPDGGVVILGPAAGASSTASLNFFDTYFRLWTGSADAVVSTIAETKGVWRHYAITRSGTTVTCYVNGAADATGSNSDTVLFSAIARSEFGPFTQGKFAEIRIWDVARTATQIGDDYAAQVDPASSGLVRYYRLDETSGQVVNDLTSNAQHGTFGADGSTDTDDPTPDTSGPDLTLFGASGAIAATVSTTATITGTAGGGTSLAATPSTTAAVAGALGHTPNAALSTTASVAGTLGGNTALAATPSTTASVAGTVTGRTALAATPSTTASVAGTLGGITALAASPSTTATIAGTFDAPDNLAAALSTTATVTATPGAIVSISAALSTTAGLVVNTGNEDDYYPSPDVDEAVKSPYPPNYIPDPDEPEYINDPPDG